MTAFGLVPRELTQAINPWAWRQALQQMTGFINIYAVNSPDPDSERRIIENVGSYGRQLGWITEALQVLITIVDREVIKTGKLSRAEESALYQITKLTQDVRRIKGEPHVSELNYERHEFALPDVDRFISDLEELKGRNSSSYDQAIQRLRDALGL